MKFHVATYILILGFLLASCTTNDSCSEETDVNLKIGFLKRTQNQTTGAYSISTLTIDSIWAKGFEKDSFLYKNSKFKNSILLPLKINANQSEFVIRFNDKTDTLRISHENNDQHFLSLECGSIVTHSIKKVAYSTNFIDSISIINPEVTNFDATHLQIFN